MPTRGGFLAFFERAGTAIVELSQRQPSDSGDERPSLLAALNELASAVKDAVGSPRNYVGFVPVPEPVLEATPQVLPPHAMVQMAVNCKLVPRLRQTQSLHVGLLTSLCHAECGGARSAKN